MQYAALINVDEGAWDALDDDKRAEVMQSYGEFAGKAQAAGVMAGGNELSPTHDATTVRVRDGQTLVVDGPYAEVKDVVNGYLLAYIATIRTDETTEQEERVKQLDPRIDRRLRRGCRGEPRGDLVHEVDVALVERLDRAWVDLAEPRLDPQVFERVAERLELRATDARGHRVHARRHIGEEDVRTLVIDKAARRRQERLGLGDLGHRHVRPLQERQLRHDDQLAVGPRLRAAERQLDTEVVGEHADELLQPALEVVDVVRQQIGAEHRLNGTGNAACGRF